MTKGGRGPEPLAVPGNSIDDGNFGESVRSQSDKVRDIALFARGVRSHADRPADQQVLPRSLLLLAIAEKISMTNGS